MILLQNIIYELEKAAAYIGKVTKAIFTIVLVIGMTIFLVAAICLAIGWLISSVVNFLFGTEFPAWQAAVVWFFLMAVTGSVISEFYEFVVQVVTGAVKDIRK